MGPLLTIVVQALGQLISALAPVIAKALAGQYSSHEQVIQEYNDAVAAADAAIAGLSDKVKQNDSDADAALAAITQRPQ